LIECDNWHTVLDRRLISFESSYLATANAAIEAVVTKVYHANFMSASNTQFASAVSTSQDLSLAIDEVCKSLDSQLDASPDVVFVFGSADRNNADSSGQLVQQLNSHLTPKHLLGCMGESIVGREQEIEMQPALSVWAACLAGTEVCPMHLRLEQSTDGAAIVGWPETLSESWPEDSTLLLLGDPYSFPADVLLARLNEDQPGTQVVGGMASAGSGPGENQLLWNDRVLEDGAVAILLHGKIGVRTVVSQGCRPIGKHFVITKSEQNVIYELGGRPALLQLKEIFDQLSTREQGLVQTGLHVGRVVTEYQDRFEQGDFLVRNVMGIDPNEGSIAVGDYVRPGQTVQFHIRDHETADHELRQLLRGVADDDLIQPLAGLLFTCNGRGTRLFQQPDHDAASIADVLGAIPLAGFFAAGELGPIGGKSFTHGFTASLAVFHEKTDS
jgi:small ligand-binding sensory domain FIST